MLKKINVGSDQGSVSALLGLPDGNLAAAYGRIGTLFILNPITGSVIYNYPTMQGALKIMLLKNTPGAIAVGGGGTYNAASWNKFAIYNYITGTEIFSKIMWSVSDMVELPNGDIALGHSPAGYSLISFWTANGTNLFRDVKNSFNRNDICYENQCVNYFKTTSNYQGNIKFLTLTGKNGTLASVGGSVLCLLDYTSEPNVYFSFDNEHDSPDKGVIKKMLLLTDGNLAVWSHTGWLKVIIFLGFIRLEASGSTFFRFQYLKFTNFFYHY